MRGLPFNCTEKQIINFFTDDYLPSGIIDNGIIFIYKNDGKLSGDAFVIFCNEFDFERALMKNKKIIGSRYIKLFKANISQLHNYLLNINSNIKYGYNKKDCIRLRGLPFEAQIPEVIQFLGEYVYLVKQHGIHMILNNNGEPSGEAFIQLISEEGASHIVSKLHNKFMEVGKKKRYIEVFQLSINDIKLMAGPNILNTFYPQMLSYTSFYNVTEPTYIPSSFYYLS
ncbi:RNA-binding protein fusilli [Strongyloides ratti]|uniref:RNA-binding protein fusilli n=1 Tax=Strongyloides ratti TaxID=34506 RepID=A0A090MWI7_STRRB|nr:RNA-binding protein fusilli [Strongyloides ratti]CEF63784.1 RNA-binding protein fusilli [Strongyloides ratti]